MARYVVRRLIQAIPILIGISVIAFFIVYSAPGDPFDRFRSNRVSPEVIENLRRVYGLDQPLPVQFFNWFTTFWTFPWDPTAWGYSITDGLPGPRQDLRADPQHAPADGDVALPDRRHRDPGRDPRRGQAVQLSPTRSIAVVATIGYALPTFWLGLILRQIFAQQLDLFPLFGKHTFGKEGDLLDLLWHLFLPVLTLDDRRRRRVEPLHAGVDAGGAAGRLHPDGEGQGPRLVAGHLQARPAERPDPDRDPARPDDPDPARRRRDHRGRLLLAGPRLPRASRRCTERDYPVVLAFAMIGGVDGHPRQPARRRPLRGRRPADQVLGATTMESTQTTPLARRRRAAVDEVDLTPVRTYWQLVRQRFVRHRLAVIAFFLMTILIIDGDRRSRSCPATPGRRRRSSGSTSRRRSTAPLGYDNLGINTFAAPDEGPPDVALHRLLGGRRHRPHRRDRRLHRRLLRRLGRQRAHALRRRRPVDPDLLPDRHARRLLGHRQRLGDHHRHRPDGLDDGRAARPGGVPLAARGRLRAGGQGARRRRPADRSCAT